MIPSFYRLREVAVTASTNADAKQAAEAGEPEGLVIQALSQTSGRGRQGRVWESPDGNIYASVLLRPRCLPLEVGYYSFVTALAVYDAVHEFLPQARIELKWPNDVLVGGKKISGILLEAAPIEKGLVDWLVIGVGVNVRHFPENALYPATSLLAEGADASVPLVLENLLKYLLIWQDRLKNDGFEPVRIAWLGQARKGALTARLPQEVLEGTFSDLDRQGNLILQLADGSERAIAAADVYFPNASQACC